MKWEKLKPIVVLTAICVIVSAALVGTYGLTKPVIDAAKAAEANAALSAVLPDGADFEEVTVSAENVLNAYKAGNGAGYVFQAQGKGFAGMITVMVGISSDGAITGTQVMEHGETPGIGDRIEKEAHFQEQYLGKDYNLEGIEFLSGATFSSNYYINAIRDAFTAYDLVKEGQCRSRQCLCRLRRAGGHRHRSAHRGKGLSRGRAHRRNAGRGLHRAGENSGGR